MTGAVTMLAEDELTEVNARLANATPVEILQWAVERFQSRLTMATAFGPEGCILIHLLAEVEPRVRIFNLDTGYQFPETLALRDRIAATARSSTRLRALLCVGSRERACGGIGSRAEQRETQSYAEGRAALLV